LKKFLGLSIALFGFMILSGCTTLEQRLAKRVGCDDTKLSVAKDWQVPGAYRQYEFTCENQKWTCRDAPFVKTCNKGWHRDQKKK